jgi:hypothetical protein
MKRVTAVAFCVVLNSWNVAFAETCGLTQSFKQADFDRDTNKPVQRKVLFDDSVVVFSAKMRVDADGGPRTYSAKDPGGTLCNPKLHPENIGKDPGALGCAMDTLCVGANIQVPGGAVYDYRSCSKLQDAFRIIRDSNWNPPPGYKLISVGIEMKDAAKGIPCIDANSAYFVSTSSTRSGEGGKRCEQKKWLDTLVPSIVAPKCWSNAYRENNPKDCASLPMPGIVPDVDTGDLVALRGRNGGRLTFGVIGDLGPNKKLGEASVGMLMKAAGLTEPPTYVAAANKLDGLEQFDVVVFKRTKFEKPLTLANAEDMAKVAEGAFKNWTGDVAKSREKLAACGASVSAK